MTINKILTLSAGILLTVAACVGLNFTRAQAKLPPKDEARVTIKKGSAVFINDAQITEINVPIASGSKLETSVKDEAAVLINGVGRLQLEKRTRVILNYTNRETSVFLENGCATLWVEPGMKGSLKSKTEEKLVENNKEVNSIEICADRRFGGILLWSALGAGGALASSFGSSAMEKPIEDEVIITLPGVVSGSSLRDLGN